MRSVTLGVVAVMLFASVFVSQVEAKNDKHDDNNKNQQAVLAQTKNDKHEGKDKNEFKHQLQFNNTSDTQKGSVPIPATLLLFGIGFAGLVAWRARKPQA